MQNDPYKDLDRDSAKTWIYPINLPLRKYQYDIVKTALYQNTLVCLPTGLGKTFIGAVVMYNFYRWYPTGKVVFMAPTRPLVAQQIESCFNIMGIPQENSIEMTGFMSPEKRNDAWIKIGIFFLTPQVLMNDLARGVVPLHTVKLIVVDEAHKALGDQAYCQVVKILRQQNYSFRILALSATPGNDIPAVQQILHNLLISKIELRSEESPDVAEYTHLRTVETIVVQLDDELKALKQKYMEVLKKYVQRLVDRNILFTRDESTLTKFQILKAREGFRQNPPVGLSRQVSGVMEGTFALCLSLYHGLELLTLHGARSLYKFLSATLDNKNGAPSSSKGELSKNQQFLSFYANLGEKYCQTNPTVGDHFASSEYIISHPKLRKLQEVVIDHFSKSEENTSTRIMIFSQYRESVLEITEMLQRHQPLVKPMSFIGQTSTSKNGRGFSQKQQLKVLKDFKEGGYNTLISTCVGEEGLDIGDVDLIVCYDAQKSPIRIVQRMGRTGRKRRGKIVVLVTEGKEHQDYMQGQYQKKSLDNHLSSGGKFERYLYPSSSRMIPPDIEPMCVKMQMQVREWKSKDAMKKNTKNIDSFFKQTDKNQPSTSVKMVPLLTEEQMLWYKKNLQIAEDLKGFQRPRLLCISAGESSEPQKTVDLGDFQPWQTTLQPWVSIQHTKKTENLVKLTQFIGIQSFAEETEYEDGLRAYLNMDYFKKDVEKSTENDVLDRRKRKRKNTSNRGRKKAKRDLSIAKPRQHISSMFADINKRNKRAAVETGIVALSDDDDIIIINDNGLSVTDNNDVEMETLERSHFANLKLDYDSIFSSPPIATAQVISFQNPPAFQPELIRPCSHIEVKEIVLDLMSELEGTLKAKIEQIFAPKPNIDICDTAEDIVNVDASPNSYTDVSDVGKVAKKLKLSDFNLKSPLLGSTYRARNITSTPIQMGVKCVSLSVTPIISKCHTSLFNICEEKSNQFNDSVDFDLLDEEVICDGIKKSATVDQKNVEIIRNRSSESANVNPRGDEVISTKGKESENVVLLGKQIIPNMNKESVNFNLLGDDIFSDENRSDDSFNQPCEIVEIITNDSTRPNLCVDRNSIQKKDLSRSNQVNEPNPNPKKELVNFDLLDDDLFRDFDLTTLEQKSYAVMSPRNEQVSNLGSKTKYRSAMSPQHNWGKKLPEKEQLSSRNLSTLPFATPKLGNQSTNNKTIKLNADRKSDVISVTQVIDMMNDTSATSKWSSKDSTNTRTDFSSVNQSASVIRQQKEFSDVILRESSPEYLDTSQDDFSFKILPPPNGWISCDKSTLKTDSSVKSKQGDKRKRRQKVMKNSTKTPVLSCNNTNVVSKNTFNDIKNNHQNSIDDDFEDMFQSVDFIQLEKDILELSTKKPIMDSASHNAKSRLNETLSPEQLSHSVSKIISRNNDKTSLVKNFSDGESFSAKSSKRDELSSKHIPYCKPDVHDDDIINIASDSDETDAMHKHGIAKLSRKFNFSPDGKPFGGSNCTTEQAADQISPILPSRKLFLSQTADKKSPKNISFLFNSQTRGRITSSTSNNNQTIISKEPCFDTDFDFEPHLLDELEKKYFASNADSLSRTEASIRLINATSKPVSISTKSCLSHSSASKHRNKSYRLDNSLLDITKSFNSIKNDSVIGKQRSNFANIIDSDSDGDFEIKQKKSFKRVRKKDDEDEACVLASKRAKRPANKAVKFIEFEADVSSGENSEDESESELDCYDASFIDDQARLSQQATDMQAVYLRSVRSPVKKPITVGRLSKTMSIQNQLGDTSDEDSFEDEDSFVVDNDVIEYETQFMGTQMLAEDPIINQALANILKAKDNKKRTRIINCISSEEETSPKCPPTLANFAKTSSPVLSMSRATKRSSLAKKPVTDFSIKKATANLTHKGHSSSTKISSRNLFPEDDFSSEELFQPLKPKLADPPTKKPVVVVNPFRELTKPKAIVPGRIEFAAPSCSNVRDVRNSMNVASSATESTDDTVVYFSQTAPNVGHVSSGNNCVMIDTMEITVAGLTASHLRLQCGVQTFVTKIHPASYVLSSRTGVYRLHYSVFSKNINRSIIVERVKNLLLLYERPTLIVEKDNSLKIQNIQRSLYVDTISCALTQLPQLKLLYSNCQEETCALLEHLLKIEKIKGYSLPTINLQDGNKNNIFKFYSCIPKLSPASAIILASKYPKICSLLSSIPKNFENECRISKDQRKYVVAHFQRYFNKDMLPPSYKI